MHAHQACGTAGQPDADEVVTGKDAVALDCPGGPGDHHPDERASGVARVLSRPPVLFLVC